LIRKDEDGWSSGTGCLKIRVGSGVVDSHFVSYFLGQLSIKKWIVRNAEVKNRINEKLEGMAKHNPKFLF